jgi:hypothetical protein
MFDGDVSGGVNSCDIGLPDFAMSKAPEACRRWPLYGRNVSGFTEGVRVLGGMW